MHGWEKKPRLFLNLIDFENLEYNLKLKPLGMGVPLLASHNKFSTAEMFHENSCSLHADLWASQNLCQEVIFEAAEYQG